MNLYIWERRWEGARVDGDMGEGGKIGSGREKCEGRKREVERIGEERGERTKWRKLRYGRELKKILEKEE